IHPMQFSHVGLITDEPKPGETFVAATRVWITDFVTHPYHVEWLRFEADSPVTGPVRTQPHVAYRVDSIEQAARGLRVLLEPFEPLDGLRVGFYQTEDGAVIELMEYEGNPFSR
ncbi:MAG: VOC family protein, partial [Planctomycetaceae bacterium]